METIKINNRVWVLGELLGAGGYGRVYVAESDGKVCAVKLIGKQPGAERELLVAEDIRGVPNVVPVLGIGETDSHAEWALLMPLAERSLRQHLHQSASPRLSEADALPILIDIATALEGLAQVKGPGGQGLAHRDLKPENVLLLNGKWCVSDFGTARYVQTARSTYSRWYIMTPQYAAPEQWRSETTTGRTDVYALGIIAYEMLMGSRPFTGADIHLQHMRDDAPRVAEVAPPLAELIEECLYKELSARPVPDRLLARLRWQTKATPATGGLYSLQQANLAETIRRGQESRREAAAHSEAARRTSLYNVAKQQLQSIGDDLRKAILSYAPKCIPGRIGYRRYMLLTPLESPDMPGWALVLNAAELGLSGPSDCLEGPPDPYDYYSYFVFDVICIAAIGVLRNREDRDPYNPYNGRVHTLWFCDAQDEGRYGWYETAFVMAESVSYSKAYRMSHMPFAVSPKDKQDMRSLKTGQFAVGWPFTLLEVGHLGEFIDRWSNWFSAASQGRLPHPSTTPTPNSARSWRTLDSPDVVRPISKRHIHRRHARSSAAHGMVHAFRVFRAFVWGIILFIVLAVIVVQCSTRTRGTVVIPNSIKEMTTSAQLSMLAQQSHGQDGWCSGSCRSEDHKLGSVPRDAYWEGRHGHRWGHSRVWPSSWPGSS